MKKVVWYSVLVAAIVSILTSCGALISALTPPPKWQSGYYGTRCEQTDLKDFPGTPQKVHCVANFGPYMGMIKPTDGAKVFLHSVKQNKTIEIVPGVTPKNESDFYDNPFYDDGGDTIVGVYRKDFSKEAHIGLIWFVPEDKGFFDYPQGFPCGFFGGIFIIFLYTGNIYFDYAMEDFDNLTAEIVRAYNADPIGKGRTENCDIRHFEGNSSCGDGIEVYLTISDGRIVSFSRDGELKMITIATASLLTEMIVGQPIDQIVDRDSSLLQERGVSVSSKRKRSALLPILATRNAIHLYRNDKIIDEFDDL